MALASTTVLQIAQDACDKLRLVRPTTLVGNTDPNIQHLLALFNSLGQDLNRRYKWPEMMRFYGIDVVDEQVNYSLPVDFGSIGFETLWQAAANIPIIGPVGSLEYVRYWRDMIGLETTAEVYSKYKVHGATSTQLTIVPPPSITSTEYILFAYQSTNWLRPVYWADGATFAAGACCVEDDEYSGLALIRYYLTAAGGTTNGTATSDDTGVTDWTDPTVPYDIVRADTDVPFLPKDILTDGIVWQFLRDNNLPYDAREREWTTRLRTAFSDLVSAQTLSLRGNRKYFRLVGPDNCPDTGFNGE